MICSLRLVIISVALLAASAHARQEPADLSKVLEEFRADHELPALVAAVISSDRLLAEGVVGVRDTSSDIRATLEDLWHLGSVTKSFTSTLTARLVDQEVVEWDAELADFLGAAEGTPYQSVALSVLASHSSGMAANPPMAWFESAPESKLSLPEQRLEVITELLQQPPAFKPGTQFLYSNAGYMTLGAVLEQVTDKAWQDLLREHVLGPLKLNSAGFGAPGSITEIDQPRGHIAGPEQELVSAPGGDNPAALGPAGTLHLSIRDFAIYAQEHLKGERGNGTLLDHETYQLLHHGELGNYGYGWVDRKETWAGGGRRAIWHNGSNTMWYAMVALIPEADRAFVIVSNGGMGSQAGVHEALAKLIKQWAPLDADED
jgi:CubicO group peptidase (beta-lactamase class C family)